MVNVRRAIKRSVGRALGTILPRHSVQALTEQAVLRYPDVFFRVIGPHLNRSRTVGTMPMDLTVNGPVQFEHLAGLFASTSFDHGVISMPVRQAAYLFGLVRQMPARRVIEIGRYKGGSTLIIAAAMAGEGEFWSIDIGEKVDRIYGGTGQSSFDKDIADFLKKTGLKAHLIVGDSRTLALEAGEVDLVFIDGDHSYEGVKNDFERFGRRVRRGGAVLFDDVFDEPLLKTHSATVGRLVQEVLEEGEFRLVKGVNRLAHLERIG